MVSANGTPRWLLPAGYPRIDSVLAGWSPYRWSSRAGWKAVRAAHRLGSLPALPHVATCNIAGIDEIDWRSLGWTGNSTPVSVVYVGTPGMSRKAVIHLVDRASGRCAAILKVPLTETSKGALAREAEVLVRLAEEGRTCAPRLIYVDRDRGISAQTVLTGTTGRRKFGAMYSDLLRSLMLAGESTTIVEHAAEWQEQALWAAGCESDIEIMAAAVSELCDARPLPACWVHGDFAPWNIRHMAAGSAGLLDWEEARRGGLPLHDAFHFLHIQDWLFGVPPAAHFKDISPFARTIGITPEQCRRLEIAYLASRYLQQLTRHEFEHADFLLDGLGSVLGERLRRVPRRVSFTTKGSHDLAQAPTPPTALRIRNELFSAFLAQLNSTDIRYCLLSGYDTCPEKVTSDVDFMVHPGDMYRVAPLLSQVAHVAGGALVQAIPHETSACYFVLAKHDGSPAGYLDPDCSGDYRNQGRLWLSAEEVLAQKRHFKDFYVPSVADEFTYYLIKKLLKQAITACQLRRLCHLYQRDPANCRSHLLRFLSRATVRAVEKALVQGDLGWFQSNISDLRLELKASAPVDDLGSRVAYKLRNAWRWVGRVLHPTGMFVLVTGGERTQRSQFAEALLRSLAPAFRRAGTVQFDAGAPRGLIRSVWKLHGGRLRSTLLIGTASRWKFGHGLRLGWLSHLVAYGGLRPDFSCALVADGSQTRASKFDGTPPLPKGHTLHLQASASMQENVRQASEAILRWMAARVQQRLAVEHQGSAGPVAVPVGGERVESAPVLSLE